MSTFPRIILASLGIFLFLLSPISIVESLDTYQIPLKDAIEIHMKPHIDRLLPEKEKNKFYEQYYEDSGSLEGFSIDKLLDMFGADKADNGTCHMCNSVIGLGRQLLMSAEAMITLLGGLCHDSESITRRVCLGTLERVAGPLVWLFQHSPLHTEEICSVLIHHDCLKMLEWKGDNKSVWWELPLPEKKDFKPKEMEDGEKRKKVLHLTDIHLDLWYEGGSNASCNEPLCCRATSLDTHHEGQESGYWAHVNGDCDIPVHFVDDALKQISSAHPDIDVIFWTGDNVPHDVWNTTQEVNLLHINTVSKLVEKYFPKASIFPTLGNHETHPINLYVPTQVIEKDPSQNMTWLYGTLANDIWSTWLPEKSQKENFLRGGFYSKLVTPNWKVLVLNTNTGQTENFWAIYDPMDPDGQLAWMIQELEDSESKGQFVSFLGHIPPGHGLYNGWFHNLVRIIDRYSHLITGSWFGHSHNDQIMLIYNQKKEPIHVTYISGSITTYSYLNPGYTIFDVNERGFPLNSTAYMTDMNAANQRYLSGDKSTKPEWRKEYSAVKSYHLEDMSPKSWDNFLERTKVDLDLAYLYADHYHHHSVDFQVKFHWNATVVAKELESAKKYSPFWKK